MSSTSTVSIVEGEGWRVGVQGGRWRVEGGGCECRVEVHKWRMEDGGCRMGVQGAGCRVQGARISVK